MLPVPLSRRKARPMQRFSPFLFKGLRTLPFSVSRNSFACHSYENCWGVPQFFPFWNSRPLRSQAQLPFPTPYLLSSHTLAHFFVIFCTYQKNNSFVFMQFRTLCKKAPGVGIPPSFTGAQNEVHRHQDKPVMPLSSTGPGSQDTCHRSPGCRPHRRVLRFGVP